MTSNQSPNKDVSIVLTRLKEIVEAVMHAAEAGTLEEVLEEIAEAARELVNARYAALGVPDGRGGLKFFKTAGLSEEEISRISHRPEGLGLLGVIMNEREVLRLADMTSDERRAGFPHNHPEMTSLLGVPIQVGQQLFGMLYLSDREDGLPFDAEDQWLVESLAGYAALAIAGVQLNEQENRLTLMEERERVAMELHDGTIQSLYAIGMQLQLLRLTETMRGDDLAEVVHSLDMVIEDIRSYILDLKTAAFEQKTLYECLQDTLLHLHVPETLHVEIRVPDRRLRVTALVLEATCQISREVISNVIRHAEATHMIVRLEEENDTLALVIEDNGRGFETAQLNGHGGLGLRNIRQRARRCGGELHIKSTVGVGTCVTITVPQVD